MVRRSLMASLLALGIAGTFLPLGGAALVARGPALSFAAAKHYTLRRTPCALAIGDVDGGGKPDVVTAGCDSNSVSVLLNRGDGALGSERDYEAGRNPERVDLADLNADGKSDLVVASRGPSVAVLLNQGDGTFGPGVRYALERPPDRELIGDLNGDDRPDLVIETSTGSATFISVLLNRGDGSLDAKRDYPVLAYSGDFALGDLTGDARPELVVVDPYGFRVLLNGGDGSFETSRDYDAVLEPRLVAIGDLNADGTADVATTGSEAATEVFLNRGDGSLAAGHDYDPGCACTNEIEPQAIAIADVNGDRLPDLVTKRNGSLFLGIHEGSRFVGEILVLINKGHGTFRPHRYKGFYGPSGLFVTDLNGDGRVDIAAEREERGVAVLLNRGGGSFEPRVDYRFPTIEGGTSMADLSSDDRPDLVGVALKTHALAVKLNTPGLCNVQDLRGLPLTAAKESLRRSNCRAGKVRRVRKKGAARGRVISQRPGFGAVRPGGAKVQLVVSRGRRG